MSIKSIVGAVTIIGGVVAVPFVGLMSAQYFAPKYEALRRDVMVQSRAYNEATVQELYRLKIQYEAAENPAAQQTIAAAVKHQFSIVPHDTLPPDLVQWFNTLN